MKPEQLERLLWEQTEGTITAADRVRLDAHLAVDPTAERQRHEVKAVADLLGSVGEVAAPPALQARIEAAIAALPRPRPRLSWSAIVNEMLAPQWRVRMAWAVVGLVVGITATALMVADFGHTAREDVSRFYGTMASLDTSGAAPLSVELPDALGTLVLSSRGGALLVDLEVTRPVAGGAAVEVTGGGLALVGFQGSASAASRVEAGVGSIVAAVDGAGHIVVKIGAPSHAGVLRVRVSAGGKTVVERALDVGGLSRQ